MRSHLCTKSDCTEILLSAYPHLIERCSFCNQVIKMIPIDDLPEEEIDKVQEIIKRHGEWKNKHGGGNAKP